MPKIVVKAPNGDRTYKEYVMKDVLAVANELSKLWKVEIGKTDIIPGFFPVTNRQEMLNSCIEIFAWDLPGREESKEEIKALFKKQASISSWCRGVYISLEPPGLYKKC